MHLFEMYNKLNPNQRREVQREAARQRRIEELEGELHKAKKKATAWKYVLMVVFAVVVALVLGLK
jgi:cell division septal protein FtsQ